MTLKLYDWVNSYNSRKIAAIAFETDQTLTCQAVNMQAGQHKTPEFLAMNPNGKVPVLTDGNFSLWESNAIACYIAAKDPSRRLLPTNPEQRARIDQWLFWQTAHLSPSLGKIAYERIWKPRLGQGVPDEAAIEAAWPDIKRFLGVLDTCLSKSEYLAGDLSVADFCLAVSFLPRQELRLEINQWPNISRWLNKIESRPSWQAADMAWKKASN
jgi:glutathione S-transferase